MSARGADYTWFMPSPLATVFGGTGFLGRRIVRRLANAGMRVRIAARHPEVPDWATPGHDLEPATADVRDEAAVARALEGADAVVNAVSLYVEKRGGPGFDAVHVEGAARVALLASAAGASRLLHVSGLGVDPDSESAYVRARWRGEVAVQEAFPAAVMLRPSALFGPRDALLAGLAAVTRLPVVPLFGDGSVRLQPVFVADLAAAAARLLDGGRDAAAIYEFGGAETLSYRELVAGVLAAHERRRLLLPVPFAAWRLLARLMQLLPRPPLTRDQVVLMARDNVVAGSHPGFAALDIAPRGVLEWLRNPDHTLS